MCALAQSRYTPKRHPSSQFSNHKLVMWAWHALLLVKAWSDADLQSHAPTAEISICQCSGACFGVVYDLRISWVCFSSPRSINSKSTYLVTASSQQILGFMGTEVQSYIWLQTWYLAAVLLFHRCPITGLDPAEIISWWNTRASSLSAMTHRTQRPLPPDGPASCKQK